MSSAARTRAEIDAEVARAVRDASHFVVSLFRGPGLGHYQSGPIMSLADARIGLGLVERHFQTTRQAIVYAISRDGGSTMIPRTFNPEALMENATMTKTTKSTSSSKGGLTALAAKIENPQSSVMSAAKADAMGVLFGSDTTAKPGALQDAKGQPLPKAALRDLAKGVAAATRIDGGSAKEARKASAEIDLTIPAHLKRGTAEFKAWAENPAVKEKAAAIVSANAAKAVADKIASDGRVTKEELRAQVSAAKPKKETKVKTKTERKASPDALKPIVPRGGAAVQWWADLEAKALKGTLPAAPDFTADTHKPYRDELKAVVAMAKAGDIAGLKADKTQPTWNSRTQIVRYRELCLIALHAKAGKAYKVAGDHRDAEKKAETPAPAKKAPAETKKAAKPAKKVAPKKAAKKVAAKKKK